MGHIVVLLVAPAWQRRGIGTALYAETMHFLRKSGAHRVQLGAGSPRFFPGVPDTMPSALAFFRKHGWEFDHVVYDLTQDLRTYTTPPYIWERMQREHIHFDIATKRDEAEILAFEAREFPQWLDAFQRVVKCGDYFDVLLGDDSEHSLSQTAQPALHLSRQD